MKTLSIVIIGLNEEKRLRACFDSIFNSNTEGYDFEVIYIDSGSTDRSIDIAKSFQDVKVVILEDSAPSAAKARNLGAKLTSGEIIQFIDGDSRLDTNWLRNSLPILESNSSTGIVFGAIEEIGDKSNIYMRVCRFDWYTPPGEYRLCGGNALWKRKVFDESGMFDISLAAGEEPDLCYRVRQNGYRIICLDMPMVKHDLDMHDFKSYWQRSVRSGFAYAVIAMRFRKMKEKLWLKEMIRNFLDPAIWLLLLFSGVLIGWSVSMPLLFLFLFYRMAKIFKNVSSRSTGVWDSMLYALHTQFSRIPLVYGQLLGLVKVITNKNKSVT